MVSHSSSLYRLAKFICLMSHSHVQILTTSNYTVREENLNLILNSKFESMSSQQFRRRMTSVLVLIHSHVTSAWSCKFRSLSVLILTTQQMNRSSQLQVYLGFGFQLLDNRQDLHLVLNTFVLSTFANAFRSCCSYSSQILTNTFVPLSLLFSFPRAPGC